MEEGSVRPSQGPIPNNTQQSKETDIHVPGRIRTHNSANDWPHIFSLISNLRGKKE
jgi:hypothetical protein